MLERRSSRKQINYASAFGSDDSGDEDFISSKAPPSKKAKSSQDEKPKRVSSQESSQGETKSKPKRKKLDDKCFERELKLAMEMSMQGMDPGLKDQPRENGACTPQHEPGMDVTSDRVESLKLSRHDIHSPPKSPCMSPPLLIKEDEDQTQEQPSKQPVMPSLVRFPSMKGPSDEIEYLGTFSDDELYKKDTRCRRTSSGRTVRKKIELDPEYSAEDEDSEFEEYDESDEEFECDSSFGKKHKGKNTKDIKAAKSKKESTNSSRKSTTAKGKQNSSKTSTASKKDKPIVNKSLTASPSPSSPVPCTKSATTTTVATTITTNTTPVAIAAITSPRKLPMETSSIYSSTKPSVSPSLNSSKTIPVNGSTPISAKVPVKRPAWNPPGIASVGSSSLNNTSPSAGIRIGLSRNQKVKSLHPTLKAQH